MRPFISLPACPALPALPGLMSRLGLSALLVSIGMIGVTSTASAANADVDVTVTKIPASVSVKRAGLVTYASYAVTIRNKTTNVINNVTFSGSTSVSDSTETAPWKETIQPAPYCTSGPNSIQCAIGQLRGSSDPAGSVASFVVLFNAPTSGSQIVFTWKSSFSSGNSASTPPANYATFSGTEQTGLTTSDDATITKSFITSVPTLGGTFCTGFNCLPSPTDEGSTQVGLTARPGGDGTAKVDETTSGDVCAGGFSCVVSAITVPGVFDNLIVTLTRSGAYIKPGLKIENTPIYYTPDSEPPPAPPPITAEIGLCVGFGTLNPLPPASETDRPCIAFRTQFPKNYKADPNLSSAMQWVIYSRHNGLMKF